MKGTIAQSLQKVKDPATRLDEQFVSIMKEVERYYEGMSKHDKVKIELWTKKLCTATANLLWKQNRNVYSMLLLDMVLNNNLEEPFNKIPSDGPLPILNRQLLVNSSLLNPTYFPTEATI